MSRALSRRPSDERQGECQDVLQNPSFLAPTAASMHRTVTPISRRPSFDGRLPAEILNSLDSRLEDRRFSFEDSEGSKPKRRSFNSLLVPNRFSLGDVSSPSGTFAREASPFRARTNSLSPFQQTPLREISFFNTCSDSFLETLGECITLQLGVPGEDIVRQGDTGTKVYILYRGDAHIIVDDDIKMTITDGALFGEVAAMCCKRLNQTRTATVRASTICQYGVLERDCLKKVMKRFPSDEKQIQARLRERMKEWQEKGRLPVVQPSEREQTPGRKKPPKRKRLLRHRRSRTESEEGCECTSEKSVPSQDEPTQRDHFPGTRCEEFAELQQPGEESEDSSSATMSAAEPESLFRRVDSEEDAQCTNSSASFAAMPRLSLSVQLVGHEKQAGVASHSDDCSTAVVSLSPSAVSGPRTEASSALCALHDNVARILPLVAPTAKAPRAPSPLLSRAACTMTVTTSPIQHQIDVRGKSSVSSNTSSAPSSGDKEITSVCVVTTAPATAWSPAVAPITDSGIPLSFGVHAARRARAPRCLGALASQPLARRAQRRREVAAMWSSCGEEGLVQQVESRPPSSRQSSRSEIKNDVAADLGARRVATGGVCLADPDFLQPVSTRKHMRPTMASLKRAMFSRQLRSNPQAWLRFEDVAPMRPQLRS